MAKQSNMFKYLAAHKGAPKLDTLLTGIILAWLVGINALAYPNLTHIGQFWGAIAGTAVMIKACKQVFTIIGQHVMMPEKLTGPRNLRKFADQGWQLSAHFLSTVGEIYLLSRSSVGWSWLTDCTNNDVGGVWEPTDPRTDDALNAFYLVQLAIWMVTGLSHRFLEARHKDYFVMYTHHIATVSVIGLSWCFGVLRIGLVVMFLHDSSDILADCLKLSNYAGLDADSGYYLTEGIFAVHMVTWAYTRIWYFGFYVITSVRTGAAHWSDKLSPGIGNGVTVCMYFLMLLWTLHIWWYYLFCRIIFKIMTQEKIRQVSKDEYEGSSASEDDDEEDEKQKKR
eukprot:m.262236 g.262236  ORF g.262236 m.262236 type:complete len:339 (+) comp44832_c0_seq1:145-1161(+)